MGELTLEKPFNQYCVRDKPAERPKFLAARSGFLVWVCPADIAIRVSSYEDETRGGLRGFGEIVATYFSSLLLSSLEVSLLLLLYYSRPRDE